MATRSAVVKALRAISQIVQDDAKAHVGVLFVLSLFIACRMPAQNDTWWQLRAGQDLWSGASVFVDHYSFTRAGAEWLNREWLSQALFFKLVDVGGLPLLTACLAFCVTAALAVVGATIEGPTRKRLLLLLALLIAATPNWSLRPQVFSFIGLALTMWLIHSRRFRVLPLVFLVWANLHGGVIIGVGVVVVFAVVSLLNPHTYSREALVAYGAALAATVFTPLGIRLWTTMPGAIRRFRDIGIVEFQPLSVDSYSAIVFVALVSTLLGLLLLQRPWQNVRSLLDPYLVSALVVSGGAVVSWRNIAAASLLLVIAVDRLSRPFDWRFVASTVAHPRLNRALLITIALLASASTAWEWTSGGGRRQWQPLTRSAIEALDRCDGNLYNRFDDGGYLIWFMPERRVFMDSRGDPYDNALMRDHARVEATGAFEELFSRFRIRCALAVPGTPLSRALAQDGWSPSYLGQDWVVLASGPARN